MRKFEGLDPPLRCQPAEWTLDQLVDPSNRDAHGAMPPTDPAHGACAQAVRLSLRQQLQVIALPSRIELVPSQPPVAVRGFLQGDNTFAREGDRL